MSVREREREGEMRAGGPRRIHCAGVNEESEKEPKVRESEYVSRELCSNPHSAVETLNYLQPCEQLFSSTTTKVDD